MTEYSNKQCSNPLELLYEVKEKLKDHIYNNDLVKGKDFKGDEDAKYISAINLYQGRFYKGNLDINNLTNSHHHFLVISGLLTIDKSIQLYECLLEDEVKFQLI